MGIIHIIAILTVVLFILAYTRNIRYSSFHGEEQGAKGIDYKFIILLLGAAFLVRMIVALLFKGHESDVNCFIGWSNRVFDTGFSGFYSEEAFTDYPPGYMYILYLLGGIGRFFKIDVYGAVGILLVKLPAILCDIATGYMIYKIAAKKLNHSSSLLCTAVYVFNPVIILNSAIWGQVDSVFTLAVVLVCYYVVEKQLPKAYFAFILGVLIKPQTLIFAPVLLYGMIEQIFLEGFQKKFFLKQLKWGILSFILFFLLILPFGADKVIDQYFKTLTSYPYATINGYNLWTLLGLNWVSQDGVFLFLKYSQWGTLFIVLIVAVSFWIGYRFKKDQSKYFLMGSFIIVSMFFLSVRMHERYLFPVVVLLLVAFLYRPRKEIYIAYLLFSVAHFYNTAHVLFQYDYQNFDRYAPVPIVIAAFTLLAYVYFLWWLYCYGKKASNKKEELLWVETQKDGTALEKKAQKPEKGFQVSTIFEKLRWYDFLAIFVIAAIYSGFALFDLGDNQAPKTSWETITEGDSIQLDLGSSVEIGSVSYFLGNYERRVFSVESKENIEDDWTYVTEFTMNSVFSWETSEVSANGRYLKLTSLSDRAVVFELSILDSNNQVMIPTNQSEYASLFDEQDLRPERNTFRESTYFDEIYHARTAYEYIHGLYSYENTHPPLGKIFIALGISLFGMNPFGWRIIGTLFGIGMIPILYIFAKRFLKSSFLATIAAILFSFDFMHFAQTRIATIDVFVTFFILIMYYFMYRYVNMSFYDTSFKKTLVPLGLCGIFMGFGIASKWTGVYAGVGLAILFFLQLYKRYREYAYAKETPTMSTNGISHDYIIKHFKKYTTKTILFCIVFFVVIPVIIYTLSYIPFVDGEKNGLITAMIKNQQSMFRYHSGVDSTHSFSSWWYQWPVMYRPIWYYSGQVTNTISEGISSFGNPLVWWAGIPAFFYMVYLAIKKKDSKAGFLMIAYLAQFIPWFFVTRITFIYHYFPSVIFVVLMIGYSMYQLITWKPKLKWTVAGYAALAVVLFLMFYPVLSGQPVEKSFVDHWLRWFPSWVLVS